MKQSINIEINGQVRGIHEWAKQYKVPYIAAYRRYKRGKVGADIFNVKKQTQAQQREPKSESFTEMVQLNLHMPKFAVEQLERIALLERTTRNKLAVKIISKYLYAPTKTANQNQNPIPVSKEPQVDADGWEILDE